MYKGTILAGTALVVLLGASSPSWAADASADEPETTAMAEVTVTTVGWKIATTTTARTKDDGSFAFSELPPGKYTLVAEKATTGRVKRLPVELKAGEVKSVGEMGLLLK